MIIKNMMDLGTVRQKLQDKEYNNGVECASDIRLIWNNCKTYNSEGSNLFLVAERLSHIFEDEWEKICSGCEYRYRLNDWAAII